MKKYLWLAVLAVIFLGFFSYPFVLERLAQSLVVSDPLQKSDLILVLGGDINGERVEEGVKLFQKGYAKKILFSGGPVYRNLSYADLMKKQALESGVPKEKILIQGNSRSTIEDAKLSLPMVKKEAAQSIILVTSPYHTRRAAKVFKKIFEKEKIKILVHPVSKSDFYPKCWWTRHEDTSYVVWEYMASVLYFLKGYW